MVEDGEGCYIGVKCLGIAKVANPRVVYYGLDEDLDAALSSLIGLVVVLE
jgi:hypothetical protein